MDIQLKKGILDFCILKVLSSGDSYGYKIIQDICDYVDISESTLYPILRRLELASYLETYKEEHHSRIRKYYKITKLGIEKLNSFQEEIDKLQKTFDFILGGTNNE